MDRNLYAYLESLKRENLRLKTVYQKHSLLEKLDELQSKEDILKMVLRWKKLSASTQKNYCATLRNYLLFLGKTDLAKVVPKVKREGLLPKQIPTQQEFKASLKNLKPSEEKTAVIFLYGTGMRISEVLNLSIYDINLETKEIRITKAKNREERMIPLPKKLAVSYNNLKKRKLKLFNLTYYQLWNYIKVNLEINPHRLRHIYAVHMLENGADINHLARLLGHKDIRSTTLYAKYVNDYLKKRYSDFHPICRRKK